MVYPDVTKWSQDVSDLLKQSMEAKHKRTRERFLALYMIASNQTNANQWSKQIGRTIDTVLSWVHKYNAEGPEALVYRRTGGRQPNLLLEEVAELIETVKNSEPIKHELPGHNWSIKKVQQWVQRTYNRKISRSQLCSLLRKHGLSWKKCQKLLKKANPDKRAKFMKKFQSLFEEVHQDKLRLIYIDEVHIHQDMDLGYTWSAKGERTWRESNCPPLAHRLNWYGAYDFTNGQCFLWQNGSCNQDNTAEFLRQLKRWIGESDIPTTIIWDGAPWHRARQVQYTAANLGFTIEPQPAYSPDLNPIEGLWSWMREDVTRNHCHQSLRHLFEACHAFIDRINQNPEQIVSRLWPSFELDPVFEALLAA